MKVITPTILKEMYISGANNLYNHYPEVDQLNVFPVPDGDTGMNMNLTVTSGMKEIQNKESTVLSVVANNFSRGLLMGARGNSGVITSQIFKGFALACEGKEVLNAIDLADCLLKAKEVAYKAVMKPVEGTILTVIRESSAALSEFVTEKTTIEQAMNYFLEQARISLQHTPDLLPVLAEVGVVDSGGAGLVRIIEGMVSAVKGEVISRNNDMGAMAGQQQPDMPLYAGAKLTEGEEGYGYCTQFIIRLVEDGSKRVFNEKTFKRFLTSHGNSVVVVRDDDIVKVHVHTLTPGNMLNYGQQFGEFVSITIENMSEEHHNIEHGQIATDMAGNIERGKSKRAEMNAEALASEEPSEEGAGEIDKKYALIAVSSGEGLNEIFRELGVDQIVSGGQTMNPSTEDFVKAIKNSKAANVFLFPNNSNILMSASQACEVMADSEVNAKVVPTKTILQGLSACMQFNPELEPDELFEEMKGCLKSIRSGSVTYAVKDTDIEGIHITKGYFMAMKDKNIVSCVADKREALMDLIGSLVRKTSSIITVICGEDVSEEERDDIYNTLYEAYGEEMEVDVKDGGQPVYSYLVGVE